jgi:hypothetical protein
MDEDCAGRSKHDSLDSTQLLGEGPLQKNHCPTSHYETDKQDSLEAKPSKIATETHFKILKTEGAKGAIRACCVVLWLLPRHTGNIR